MITNIESQNGCSSSPSSSLHSNTNLSPIPYTSQVPSPLTTITPTSGGNSSRSAILWSIFIKCLFNFSANNDANHFSRSTDEFISIGDHNFKYNVDGNKQLPTIDSTFIDQPAHLSSAIVDDERGFESTAILLSNLESFVERRIRKEQQQSSRFGAEKSSDARGFDKHWISINFSLS